MALVHVCPAEICKAIAEGDEPAKRQARMRAIRWLEAQRLAHGDTVWMPDPNTGELLEMSRDDNMDPVPH